MNRKLIILCMILLIPALFSCRKSEPVQVVYFYAAACKSCLSSEEMEKIGSKLYSKNGNYKIEVFDVYDGQGVDKLLEYINTYDLPPGKRNLPLLFIGDKYYCGLEAIKEALNHY